MAFDPSTSNAASVSSALKISRLVCTAASLPDLWPAQTWRDPLKSITSCLITLVTHLPMILRITSPTPMGRTAPSPLSRWIRRFASMASMEAGSTYSVHNLLVSVARASQRLDLDYLNDLEASILLNPIRVDTRRSPRSFGP